MSAVQWAVATDEFERYALELAAERLIVGQTAMDLDDHSRERLITALLEHGWQLDGDVVMAPKRTMWLSRETPWQGELAEMLDRMRSRLERVRRFASQEAAAEEWRETFDDTRSLVEVLEQMADPG